MQGASSEILLEAVSGNTVVSVNSMNWALLLLKPQEMVPFQSLEVKLLYRDSIFKDGGCLPKCPEGLGIFHCNEGSLYQGPHTHKQ